MKKLACLLFAAILCASVYSQDDTNRLYLRVAPATAYLQHEVFMDPTLCRNLDLFKKWESASGTNLLSNYFPIMTGSGFFIGSDGVLLTNRHVVQIDNLSDIRIRIANDYSRQIEQSPPKGFSADDLRTIKLDVYAMITKGNYRFSATIGDKVVPSLDIAAVSKDESLDLAVLKVPGGFDRGLSLAQAESVGKGLIGRAVYSFGFPLGGSTGGHFKDLVVTMNKGAVSAFRKADLSIQHTAAISHGNSGGPLVDESGAVVGMNTATIEEGNSLYLALGVDRIRDFLGKQGIPIPSTLPEEDQFAAPSGSAPIVAPVELTAPVEGAAAAADGDLEIKAPVAVQTTISGASYNATVVGNASLHHIPAGAYALVAAGPGFPSFSSSFALQGGGRAEWAPYAMGVILLSVSPKGSQCVLESGRTLDANTAQRLTPGSYVGNIKLPGYRDQAVSFPVMAGKQTNVTAHLIELSEAPSSSRA